MLMVPDLIVMLVEYSGKPRRADGDVHTSRRQGAEHRFAGLRSLGA